MTYRDSNGNLYFGKWELVLQFLILVSLLCFAFETLPGLTNQQRILLERIETITMSIFALEYLARIALSKPRLRYAFSFFGLVDLISILPFFIGLSVDFRAIRALRMLRLFRILKLARYSKAIRRFHRAFIISKEEIVLFFSCAMIMFYLAGVGIYYCENHAQPEVFRSVFDGLWWSVATLTTVGYGDAYPVTTGGRLFTFLILVIGLGIIAVPTGMVASALSKARKEEENFERKNKD
jgi:voltage-gated potassium channel